MKEKDYTAALVGKMPEKKRHGILAMLAPKSDQALFYEAVRNDQAVHLMWIEFERLGTLCAYPCLLETDDQTMVFLQGSEPEIKKNNREMIRLWNETIDKDKLADYTVLTPSAEDFYALFKDYRARAARAVVDEATEE